MGPRRPLLLLAPVCAAVFAAAACDGGGHPPVGPTAPISVQVFDVEGNAMPSLPIAATKNGKIIDESVTDASGVATIDVADGSEITAFVQRSTHYSAYTLTGVDRGSTPRIPTLDLGPTPTPSAVPVAQAFVDVTIVPADPLLTEVDASIGDCSGSYSGAVGTSLSGISLVFTSACRQVDGTISPWAVASEGGDPLYYGALPDVTPAIPGTAGTVALSLSTSATGVVITGLPSGLSALYSAADLIPFRKGVPIGPDLGRAIVSTAATASLTFPSLGTALADEFDLELDLATDFSTDPYRRYFVSRIAPPGPASETFDASDLPALPSDLEVVAGAGGRPTITFTPVAGDAASVVRAEVAWLADGNGHTWYVYLPVPTAPVAWTLPPVPGSLGAFRSAMAPSMNVSVDYIGSDFTTGLDDFADVYVAVPPERTISDSTTTRLVSP